MFLNYTIMLNGLFSIRLIFLIRILCKFIVIFDN